MANFFISMEEGELYHIFNRGNNGELIFYNDRNYLYFLQKLSSYLSDYLDFYAYCLLPNHFHLLVKVKDFTALPAEAKVLKTGTKVLYKPETIISEQFRRFFLSYSKSIKKQEGGTGSLFEKNFKRIHVDSDSYFTSLVNYIHRNPQTHGITNNYKAYNYSSFKAFLSDGATRLKRKEVLDWFGGKEEFLCYHETNPVYKEIDDLIIE